MQGRKMMSVIATGQCVKTSTVSRCWTARMGVGWQVGVQTWARERYAYLMRRERHEKSVWAMRSMGVVHPC